LVKFRGNAINSSYISLRPSELDSLIKAMHDEEFRYAQQPTEQKFVVNDFSRALAITKKEWTGKPWMLFNIQQMRKGRKFTFETPCFNFEKILRSLIAINELARSRQITLEPQQTISLLVPMIFAYMVHRLIKAKNATSDDWAELASEVNLADVEACYNDIVKKLQPTDQPPFPTDAELINNFAVVEARKIYMGEVEEEADIDLELIALLIQEYVKKAEQE